MDSERRRVLSKKSRNDVGAAVARILDGAGLDAATQARLVRELGNVLGDVADLGTIAPDLADWEFGGLDLSDLADWEIANILSFSKGIPKEQPLPVES